MRRKHKVVIRWSPEFTYAIGLIATDGNLSPDNRHISITSKDKDLIKIFAQCLQLSNKIGRKSRGGNLADKKYYVLQFGDVTFIEYLHSIGLCAAKSKIINEINIPRKYFPDFLRGCLDGDGNICGFFHPESKKIQLKIRFYSASPKFLSWLHGQIHLLIHARGGWITSGNRIGALCFGKRDAIKILRYMYYDIKAPMLIRKYRVAKKFIDQ